MTAVSVELKGADELVRKLGKAIALSTLRPAMQRSVNWIHDDVVKYPERPSAGSFAGFVSDKQRRWFFAALRRGDITVPYVRTGALGRRWTTKITMGPDALVGTIGNDTEYAPFVQSKDQQAQIHQGRWETIEQVLDDNKPAIEQEFKRAIDKALAGNL